MSYLIILNQREIFKLSHFQNLSAHWRIFKLIMYLNCHSYYSLRYGTMTIEKFVESAIQKGVNALALTDINSTMGTIDFVKACTQNGIYPVAGIEFRNGNDLLYIGIACNNEGFRELNEFLTNCSIDSSIIPAEAPAFREVYIIYPFTGIKNKRLRDNELIGVKPTDLTRLATSEYHYKQNKLVALFPVTFAGYEEYESQGVFKVERSRFGGGGLDRCRSVWHGHAQAGRADHR